MIGRFSRLLTAVSSVALAAIYLLAWAGIRVSDSGASIRYLGYLMIMEFVQLTLEFPLLVLLVGPLKDAVRLRLPRGLFFAIVGTMALVLVIFGAVLSVSDGAIWPMLGVLLLLAGKWDLYVRPPRTSLASRRVMAEAAVRLAALFFLLIPCVIIPFPAWKAPSSMEELGDFRPAGILVWGAAYFGLFGLFGHRLDKVVSDEPGTMSGGSAP